MKVANKTNNKKEKVKKKGGVNKPKPKKEQVLVVAQEIKYARWLSGNDKRTRDRVLIGLKKWILNCFEKGHEFKEEDFIRVWKGLFYAMWMSDKPLIQEELCENIAKVLDLFPAEQLKHALLMTQAGFKTLATEWYGIDHHRLDKFLMLVRRYLRGSLRCLERCEWSLQSCQKYAKMLSGTDGLFAVQTPHYARNATSMLLHFTDCFLEELAKVSEGKISEESTATLLRPFVLYMCSGGTPAVCTAARRLLTALLRQSDAGQQYEAKTRAWKQMGCPGDGPDSLEPVSDDEEQVENGDAGASDEELDDSPRPLDPRAGRVDVELPALAVPARALAAALRAALARASSAAHRRGRICLQRFEKLAEGQYPLPVAAPGPAPAPAPPPRRAARTLQQLEHKLRASADDLKLRGLSRKHRKRLLRKSRAGLSIVEDVEEHRRLSRESHNGEWLVESTEPKPDEKDTSNKENQDKPKKNKLNAHKRKNSSDLTNGDVANKKQKLDKNNKKELVTNTDKAIKKSTLVNKNQGKKGKVKNNKEAPVNKETVLVTNGTKKDDVKEKGKEAKDVKAKKSKNQPQIITRKSENSNEIKTDKAKISEKSNKTKSETTNKENETKSTEKISKVDSDTKRNKTNKKTENPSFLANKVKRFQKQLPGKEKKQTEESMKNPNDESPKKVKFALKNNSMQKPVDYYKSVRQSPSIPFDSAKKPSKTNLKPSTPSPINPFFKKRLLKKVYNV